MRRLLPTTAAILLVILVFTPAGAAEPLHALLPLRVGDTASLLLETPHPYLPDGGAGGVAFQERVSHPGASYIALHFVRLELAPGDRVVIGDPDSTQSHVYEGLGPADGGPFWALSVLGEELVVKLVSASSEGGFGFLIDSYAHGFPGVLSDSTCGNDDKQDTKCYRETHPVHYERARAAGAMLIEGAFMCTGSLISCEGHFLTNEHCRLGAATDVEVRFMFENEECGAGNSSVQEAFQGRVETDVNWELDYWVLQLEGDPVGLFGHLELDPRPLEHEEVVYIAQHPGGSPKQFGIDSDMDTGNVCRIDDTNRDGRGADTDAGYFCDTAGGSSGSPVLAESSHRVVALHHFGAGGECVDTAMNAGIRMERIGPRLMLQLPCCAFGIDLPTPLDLTAVGAGPNSIQLSWQEVTGASGYRIFRALGGCGEELELLAELSFPSFLDSSASGGTVYGYVVEALAADGCRSTPTGCVSELATGPCTLPPEFAGVSSVTSDLTGGCRLELRWEGGAGVCSPGLVYNVYRSETPRFLPSAATLRAACVSGAGFTDDQVDPGVGYHYVVRAEDRNGLGAGPCSGGPEDLNLHELAGRPLSASVLSELYDGAEGLPVLALESPWEVSAARARAGRQSYRAPGVDSFTCADLAMPPVVVTPGSVLSYSVFLEDIELDEDDPVRAWDGGTVEISRDQGRSWSPLEPTPSYPVSFLERSSSCNNDRQGCGAYAGDEAGWIDASVDLAPWTGLEVLLRFRFATDDFVVSTAWWVDEVRVTELAAGDCSGATEPPGEVSGPGAVRRLALVKRPSGEVETHFAGRPEALGYNFYQGDLGRFYNHGDVPLLCHPPLQTHEPDHVSVTLAAGTGNHYIYVTAWNGDPVTGQEGTSGSGSRGRRPAVQSTCSPANNH